MGKPFDTWMGTDLPESMYLSAKIREVAAAYEEAKADPDENPTEDEYIKLMIGTLGWAVMQIELRLLTLEGVELPDHV
jgi:hypothetical protein